MFLPLRSSRQIPTAARGPKSALALILLAGALALWGVVPRGGPALRAADAVAAEDDGDDPGAFTCDFGLSADLSLAQAVPILELDRMVMSARPGFLRKLIPLGVDPATGDVFSGGRYLFESVEDAEDYKAWLETTPLYDGVRFLDRPYILHPECHAWSVIGEEDFGDIHSRQVVVRTERWTTSGHNQRGRLRACWPALRREAQRRGLTSVWLLYNRRERLVSIVSFADRVDEPDPDEPDFASLFALANAPSLGQAFDAAGWPKRFDRTQWVLTIWFPFAPGDSGEPSVWPNSPPFPEP
jgi:hypothetical protein